MLIEMLVFHGRWVSLDSLMVKCLFRDLDFVPNCSRGFVHFSVQCCVIVGRNAYYNDCWQQPVKLRLLLSRERHVLFMFKYFICR